MAPSEWCFVYCKKVCSWLSKVNGRNKVLGSLVLCFLTQMCCHKHRSNKAIWNKWDLKSQCNQRSSQLIRVLTTFKIKQSYTQHSLDLAFKHTHFPLSTHLSTFPRHPDHLLQKCEWGDLQVQPLAAHTFLCSGYLLKPSPHQEKTEL